MCYKSHKCIHLELTTIGSNVIMTHLAKNFPSIHIAWWMGKEKAWTSFTYGNHTGRIQTKVFTALPYCFFLDFKLYVIKDASLKHAFRRELTFLFQQRFRIRSYTISNYQIKTRLHSSRMRTARLLPIFPSMHCTGVGGAWLGGAWFQGGVPGPRGVCSGEGACLW